MRKTIMIMAIVLMAIQSCGTAKVLPPAIQRDSTSVHIRDSVIIRDSIIYVRIPQEESNSRRPVSDTSHLETSVAESNAWVDEQGQLNHDLRNKDISMPAPVQLVNYLRTEREERLVEIVREVPVEKELRWSDKFLIGMGKLSIFAVLILLLRFVYLRKK